VRALLSYAFLLALLAAATGIGALRSVIEKLGPVFDGPGLPLLLSGMFATLLLNLGEDEVGTATRRTATQWLPTAGAVLTFVLAGEVVAESGAAELLAGGAETLGVLFPAVSPVLAALGGALTGSNAASNALFMPLQIEAARGLGISELLTAAVQKVGQDDRAQSPSMAYASYWESSAGAAIRDRRGHPGSPAPPQPLRLSPRRDSSGYLATD
jgi:lactate permease